MLDFSPFEMSTDGDVDAIDFLGVEYLARFVLLSDESADEQIGKSEVENLWPTVGDANHKITNPIGVPSWPSESK